MGNWMGGKGGSDTIGGWMAGQGPMMADREQPDRVQDGPAGRHDQFRPTESFLKDFANSYVMQGGPGHHKEEGEL